MHFGTGEGAKTIGQAAEAAGFESVWTVEHIIYPEAISPPTPTTTAAKCLEQAIARSPIL